MVQYHFTQKGLIGELNALDSSEVINHLKNYIGNFLLDQAVIRVYLARILRDPQLSSESVAWIRYLVNKLCDIDPLDEYSRQLRCSCIGQKDLILRLIRRYSSPQHIKSQWNLLLNQPFNIQRRALWSYLKAYPYSVDLIWRAYLLDLYQNVPIGSEWSRIVKVPTELKTIFEELLMQLNFLQGNMDTAAVYYEITKKREPQSPRWLNCAAEIALEIGDKSTAIRLYEKSLKIDSKQIPVKYRIEQLANPLIVDRELLTSSEIAILLYSYNKCNLLRQTLISLSESLIGKANIVVLINGCTDDSLQMVRQLSEQRFNNAIELISLPINIGAPAARNWLLSTSTAQRADYVAFLDDDVEVPKDWLITFLSTIKRYQNAGVVGAKVIYPGKPKRLQYLYRNIAVAKDGLIRMSLDVPNFNYDPRTYDFIRLTTNVMGCCQLLTRRSLDKVSYFDIRFSPSQMDDIAHDLDLRINGFDVVYCGLVECVHYQSSGVGRNTEYDLQKIGNIIGNDVKFFYRFYPYLHFLKRENNLESDYN